MRELEPIPPAFENRGFPIGDIMPEQTTNKSKHAIEVARLLELDDVESASNYILALSRTAQIEQELWLKSESTRTASIALVDAWAQTLIEGEENQYVDDSKRKRAHALSRTAFYTGVGIARAGFLPPVERCSDLSDELHFMSAYGHDDIILFSANSWRTMFMSHPNVFDVMDPWSHRFNQTYEPLTVDERDIVEVSMVVPYMLSSTARGINYLNAWSNQNNAVPLADTESE